MATCNAGCKILNVSHSPACIHLEMLASVRGAALVLHVLRIETMAFASVPQSRDVLAARLPSRMERTASDTSLSISRKRVLLA